MNYKTRRIKVKSLYFSVPLCQFIPLQRSVSSSLFLKVCQLEYRILLEAQFMCDFWSGIWSQGILGAKAWSTQNEWFLKTTNFLKDSEDMKLSYVSQDQAFVLHVFSALISIVLVADASSQSSAIHLWARDISKGSEKPQKGGENAVSGLLQGSNPMFSCLYE